MPHHVGSKKNTTKEFRSHEKKISLSSHSSKNCHAGGQIFLLFFTFNTALYVTFVLHDVTCLKVIRQSINSTKFLFIDTSGKKVNI